MQQQTIDRIVRPAEAEVLSGYCDVHLRRLEERGEFPHRFKLSATSGRFGAAGWRLSEIMAWLDARAASRTKDAKRCSAEAKEDEAEEADAEKDGNEEEDEEQEAAA